MLCAGFPPGGFNRGEGVPSGCKFPKPSWSSWQVHTVAGSPASRCWSGFPCCGSSPGGSQSFGLLRGGAGEEEQGEPCLRSAERCICIPGLQLPGGVQGVRAHLGPSAREMEMLQTLQHGVLWVPQMAGLVFQRLLLEQWPEPLGWRRISRADPGDRGAKRLVRSCRGCAGAGAGPQGAACRRVVP